MGREARFKLALGREKCCSSSNTLPKRQEPGEHSEHVPAERPPTWSSTETCNHISLPNTLQFSLTPRVPQMSHFPLHQQCPTNHWGFAACCWYAYLNPDTNSIFSRICTDGKQQICAYNKFIFWEKYYSCLLTGLAAKPLILESKFYLLSLSFAECILPFIVCLGIFLFNFLLFCNCNSQLQDTIFVFTAAIFYKD